MSTVLSLRVPRRVKEYIESVKDFDWKAFIVNAIEAKARELKLKELLLTLDQMNEKLLEVSAPPGWRLIREDRER